MKFHSQLQVAALVVLAVIFVLVPPAYADESSGTAHATPVMSKTVEFKFTVPNWVTIDSPDTIRVTVPVPETVVTSEPLPLQITTNSTDWRIVMEVVPIGEHGDFLNREGESIAVRAISTQLMGSPTVAHRLEWTRETKGTPFTLIDHGMPGAQQQLDIVVDVTTSWLTPGDDEYVLKLVYTFVS